MITATIEIPRSSGYRLLPGNELPGTDTLLGHCRQVFDERHELRSGDAKSGLLFDFLTDELLRDCPDLVDFALQDDLLGATAAYLQTMPVLRRVGLLWSASQGEHVDSMFLHRDPEDFTQVKLFVNVYDVDARHGPLTFLPAGQSSVVLRGLRGAGPAVFRPFRRYRDDEVFGLCDPTDLVSIQGPAGTGGFVDTSRCLHYGSRVEPGSSRLVYYVQFCRYHLPVATPANRFDRERFRHDSIRWSVLSPERR